MKKDDRDDGIILKCYILTSILEDIAGLIPSFRKYSLNTVDATDNSALKYAGDHFVSVFASIFTSEK